MNDDWKEQVKSRISNEQKEIDKFKNDRKVILDKVTKAVYEVYDLTGVKIDNLYFTPQYLDGHPVKKELGMLGFSYDSEHCFCVFYEGDFHKFYWNEYYHALKDNYKKHSWKGLFVEFY